MNFDLQSLSTKEKLILQNIHRPGTTLVSRVDNSDYYYRVKSYFYFENGSYLKLVSSPNHHRRLYNDNLFILLAEVKAILIINNFKIEPSNYYFEPNKKTYHNYYKYAEKRLGLLNRFGQTNQRIFVIIDGYKCLVDDVCLENDSLKINSTSVEVMQNTLEDGWINFEKITKVIVE